MSSKVLTFIRKRSDRTYKRLILITLVLSTIAWGAWPILKKIEVIDTEKIYNTITNFFPNIEQQINKYRVILTIVTIVFVVAYLIKVLYKEKVLLISQYSMSSSISEIDETISDKYRLIQCDINQYDISIEEAIEKQDIKIKDSLEKKYKQYYYYGVASTPYIFRLGFQFGDERNIRILHKKRDNQSCFSEINKDEDVFMELKIVDQDVGSASNELLVTLGTSFSIEQHDLKCFDPENIHRIFFYIDQKNVDSLLSYDRMKRYREQIMTNIRRIVKERKIKTIHIAAATSAGFTFYWAQNFSKTYDPEVIVYHYENGTYPWGIRIKADYSSCIVNNIPVDLSTSNFL